MQPEGEAVASCSGSVKGDVGTTSMLLSKLVALREGILI